MYLDQTKTTDKLSEPDLILPPQYFATLRRQGPSKRGECQLLAAVLEDAVNCFQKYLLAPDKQGQRLFREAQEWMMTEGAPTEDGPALSFGYICEVLGLDPGYVRGGLQRWSSRRLGRHQATRHARAARSHAA